MFTPEKAAAATLSRKLEGGALGPQFPQATRRTLAVGFRAQETLAHVLSGPHPWFRAWPLRCCGQPEEVGGDARGGQEQGTQSRPTFPLQNTQKCQVHGPWAPNISDLNSCHLSFGSLCSIHSRSVLFSQQSCSRALALSGGLFLQHSHGSVSHCLLFLYSNVIFSMRQSQGKGEGSTWPSLIPLYKL